MKSVVLILILYLAFFSGTTFASTLKSKADLNLREMISIESNGNIIRVLLGFDEIYPFLIIEKIHPQLTEGDKPSLVSSWRLRDINGTKDILPMLEGDEIRNLHWKENSLEFEFDRSKSIKICVVSNIAEGKPRILCESLKK